MTKKLGMDKMMLATRVLPFLIPIAMEPTLNLKQVCVCVCLWVCVGVGVCVCVCVGVCAPWSDT